MFLGGKSYLYLLHGEKEQHSLTCDAIQQPGFELIKPLLDVGWWRW